MAGRERSVELERSQNGWQCRVDDAPRAVDAVEVAPGVFSLLLDGQSFTIHVERQASGYRVQARGADLAATVENPRRWAGRSRAAGAGPGGRQEITAPMPGKVVRVLVTEEQGVESGQGLVVVEAMKMQNEIAAPRGGVVEAVRVREGDTVEHGAVLVVLG
jgi:biotin carboxyl carrier protein